MMKSKSTYFLILIIIIGTAFCKVSACKCLCECLVKRFLLKEKLMLFAVIFIFLEVVLEAFPVSSSGHAFLLTYILKSFLGVENNGNFDSTLLNHIGHITICCAVSVFFLVKFYPIIRHPKLVAPIFGQLMLFSFISSIITGSLYMLNPFHSLLLLPYGFGITAGLLYQTRTIGSSIRPPLFLQAVLFGLVQSCALLPGVSRLGITFACARFCGLSPIRSFYHSFIIGLPINVAGFLKGIHKAHKMGVLEKLLNPELLLAMLSSGIFLLCGLFVMERCVQNNLVWKFSYYVAMVAIMSWFLL